MPLKSICSTQCETPVRPDVGIRLAKNGVTLLDGPEEAASRSPRGTVEFPGGVTRETEAECLRDWTGSDAERAPCQPLHRLDKRQRIDAALTHQVGAAGAVGVAVLDAQPDEPLAEAGAGQKLGHGGAQPANDASICP